MVLKVSSEEFKRNYELNISDKTEKKGGLLYLKWAYAEKFLRENYPNWEVRYEEDDLFLENKIYDRLPIFGNSSVGYCSMPYLTDGEDRTAPYYFPILDFRNKPVLKNEVSFDLNTSKRRGATKLIACVTGYALQLYAGDGDEPLTSEEKEKIIKVFNLAKELKKEKEYSESYLINLGDDDLTKLGLTLKKETILNKLNIAVDLYEKASGKKHSISEKNLEELKWKDLENLLKEVYKDLEEVNNNVIPV